MRNGGREGRQGRREGSPRSGRGQHLWPSCQALRSPGWRRRSPGPGQATVGPGRLAFSLPLRGRCGTAADSLRREGRVPGSASVTRGESAQRPDGASRRPHRPGGACPNARAPARPVCRCHATPPRGRGLMANEALARDRPQRAGPRLERRARTPQRPRPPRRTRRPAATSLAGELLQESFPVVSEDLRCDHCP